VRVRRVVAIDKGEEELAGLRCLRRACLGQGQVGLDQARGAATA
jgi:hypothetical protein